MKLDFLFADFYNHMDLRVKNKNDDTLSYIFIFVSLSVNAFSLL